MVGEIYITKIFFTDLSEFKLRPVLIIKELDKNDIICLQLSTKIKKNRIIITNNDLAEGKLKKDSVVVIPKNFTLNKSLLIKKIAKISDIKFNIIKEKFCKELSC